MEENRPETKDDRKGIMLAQFGLILVLLGFFVNMWWANRWMMMQGFTSVPPQWDVIIISFSLAFVLPMLGMLMCRRVGKWRWLLFVSIAAWVVYMFMQVEIIRPTIQRGLYSAQGATSLWISCVAWQIFLLRLTWWTRSWISLVLGVCVLGMFLFISLHMLQDLLRCHFADWIFYYQWRPRYQGNIFLIYLGMYCAFLVGCGYGLRK